jgi:hypothetical protein
LSNAKSPTVLPLIAMFKNEKQLKKSDESGSEPWNPRRFGKRGHALYFMDDDFQAESDHIELENDTKGDSTERHRPTGYKVLSSVYLFATTFCAF